MPDRPIVPPLQKPVREFSIPEHSAGFFTELVSRESTRYQAAYPIKRGTLYSTLQGGDDRVNTSFPVLYFVKEIRAGTSDSLVLWVFSTEQNAQDTYNLAQENFLESGEHPVFVRAYNVRRDLWDSGAAVLNYGIPLTALLAIKVTAGGTGYAATDTVNIAGGLGAAAELVVDANGVIKSVVVTNGGSGYDSAALPAVTITTSTGAGATLVAVVQPKTALLVSQKKQELEPDSPYYGEFVRVLRVYRRLPGPTLEGQTYDRRLNTVIPFTEQTQAKGDADGLVGTNKIDIDPEDNVQSRVRTVDTAALEAALATLYFAAPAKVSFYLPDVLTGVAVTWNKAEGTGEDLHPVSQMGAQFVWSAGGSGGGTLNPRARAQASASVIPDMQPVIKQYISRDVNCINYFFWMASPVTLSSVLTRLTALAGAAVTALPVWKPETHILTGKGAQVSVEAKADSQATLSGSDVSASYSYDWGNGYSQEVGLTNRVVSIPPTIHATINLSDTTNTASATAEVDASTIAMSMTANGGTTTISAIDNSPSATTKTANGSITPASLAATTPSAIPTTGLKLVDISSSTDDFGFVFIRASVVDFSIYA